MQKYLTIAEVAEELRLPVGTLRHYRLTGRGGPKSFKIGSRLVYRREDVDAWIAEQYAASNPEAS